MKVQFSPTSAFPSPPSEQFKSPLSGTVSGRQAVHFTMNYNEQYWLTLYKDVMYCTLQNDQHLAIK